MTSCNTSTMVPAPHVSASALHAYARRRFGAVNNLLEVLACATVKDMQAQDIARIADALQVLMEDGCDAMDAVGWRLPPP